MNSALMFIAIALLAVCFTKELSEDSGDTNALIAWEAFVQTYNKEYTPEEYQYRKQQFLDNYRPLRDQNIEFYSGNSTYEFGVTQFSDLASDEFIMSYTGLDPLDDTPASDSDTILLKNSGLAAPANLDYRDQKIMTPVKDQKGCNSCWAFATISVLEAVYNRKSGRQNNSLSEQHLVDCSTNNRKCDGGWPHTAFGFIKQNGSASEASYAYNAVPGTCRSRLAIPIYRNISFARFSNLNDTALRDALDKFGPLAVSVDARPLQNYKSGILNTDACTERNHAVVLVGYVTTGPGNPYYILRNSYGPNWGEAGHFRVSAVKDCLVKKYVVAVTAL